MSVASDFIRKSTDRAQSFRFWDRYVVFRFRKPFVVLRKCSKCFVTSISAIFMLRKVSQLLLSSENHQFYGFIENPLKSFNKRSYSSPSEQRGISPNPWFWGARISKTVWNQCKRRRRVAKDLWHFTFLQVTMCGSKIGMARRRSEYMIFLNFRWPLSLLRPFLYLLNT